MSPSITYLKPKDSYKMMKSILIITTCLFGLINNSYAQRIKAELEPSDFSDINEISPFTYSISVENLSEDTFFYDNYIKVVLSFFDDSKKEWVSTGILEERDETTYCYLFVPPSKFILPKSKLVLKQKSVLCKVSNIKSSDYTPIKIKPKAKVKATLQFIVAGQNEINVSAKAKIKINPLAPTEQVCIDWLKKQQNPYYLFVGEIWGMKANHWMTYLHNEKNKESLIALDNYIIEHFPTSSFAPWAKLHRVSFIASYEREAIHSFIDQNIKTMEEIVAMPLSNVSQYEILFRALFSRINELFNLNRDVSAKSMDDEEGVMKDFEIGTRIEEVNKKLGAKFNELKFKPKS